MENVAIWKKTRIIEKSRKREETNTESGGEKEIPKKIEFHCENVTMKNGLISWELRLVDCLASIFGLVKYTTKKPSLKPNRIQPFLSLALLISMPCVFNLHVLMEFQKCYTMAIPNERFSIFILRTAVAAVRWNGGKNSKSGSKIHHFFWALIEMYEIKHKNEKHN